MISNTEMKRQITREGKRWGLVPMESPFGDILVAEDIPCTLPIAEGVFVVTRVRRDITSISKNYPWWCLLRNRKHRNERSASLRREIKEAMYQKDIQSRLDDIHHELASDIRKANKGIVRLDYGLHPGRS